MKTREKFCQHKKFVLFLDIFAKSTVWYLHFCLISTNFCFSLMLVNWVSASSKTKFWTGLIPSLQAQEWRKFMLCTDLTLIQVDSYSFRNFISVPILCMSFYRTLVLFWGVCVFFFLLQRIQGKIMPPVRQLWKKSGFELLENCSTGFIHPA